MLNLTNANIVARFTQIADFRNKAQSGSTTTLVNNKGFVDYPDDYFKDYYICFLTGSNKGVDRIVTDFVNSTGTFTFDTLDTAIDNTTEFALVEKGFLAYNEEAIDFIREEVKNDGKDLDLFLTDSQLKELHLYKTLDLICQDKFNDATDEDLYYNRHQHYNKLFEDTYNKLKADYDENEDGLIEEDEKLTSNNNNYRIIRR